MFDVAVPAPFKNVQETHEVGVHIRMGVFERIANTCPGRQVHDGVKLLSRKKVLHGRTIGQVDVDMGECRVRGQLVQAGLFKLGVVVIVEVVQANDMDAVIQELPGEVKADEAGGAGYEYVFGHGIKVSGKDERPTSNEWNTNIRIEY